ncbi:MAG: hypothetical protein PHQ22_06590 [Sulfuricurvum sp.]|nr:hypothetical protein [Sulfuricurvum sp.]MDD5386845.1 hypothetical protein [Sulfuricurvum sp.]
MKKVTLSALAAVMMSGVVYADTMTLFSDPKTGQVFTTAGEGRVAMGDFIDAKSIDMSQRESESAFSEYKDAQKKYVNVKSKAKTLEFSGTHYFGLTSNNYGAKNAQGADQSTGFEMRRNYVQVKAFLNDKDYFRVTLDATKELESTSTATGDGPASVIVKYAYLYLDKVLPYTGVEIGIAHRPWIDYEEHNSWYYRSINKVVLEDKFGTVGVDTMNSADLGVNFQTKTPYFSSEIGLFNGEGYHSTTNQKNNSGLSAEWRLTGHVMGNGEQVGKYKIDKDTYANISFAGLSSQNHKMDATTNVDATSRYNRNAMWVHAVYNQPFFLIAAQYNISKDGYASTPNSNREIRSWSVNGEIRPIQDWTVLARFDDAKVSYPDMTTAAPNSNTYNVGDTTQMIYGVAYKYNKNVKFIASGKTVNAKDGTPVAATTYEGATTTGTIADKQSWMLTTEVEW